MLIGIVKVEVRTEISNIDQQKNNQIFERTTTQTGLWIGTIFENIYIGNKVFHIEHSKQLSQHQTTLVNTVSVKRGLCIMFEENSVWCQIAVMIHSLLAIFVFAYFVYSIGGKIKQLLENRTASATVSSKFGNNKVRNLLASLIFIILGLCLSLPLRYLYLTNFNDQVENIVGEISHQVGQKETNVYLFINVDWVLVLYFSFLNVGFLLSFSYCSATLIELIQEELIQKITFSDNQNDNEIVPAKYFIV